jgi:nucleoside-diphosphate-sugar epimerase
MDTTATATQLDQRVLVTGARGFIGHHLVRRLASGGAQVHAISRRGPAETGDVTWWQLDLHDPNATERLVRSVRPDVVFHLASTVTGARDLDVVLPTIRNNLVSTVNLLTAAAAATPRPRVVLAGSVEEPRTDDLIATPSSPYAAAKWACSTYARMFQKLWDLPIIILRIAMVYGPGQRDLTKLVPYVIGSLYRQRAPQLTDGTRHIDWIYVDDVVEAFLAAACSEQAAGHAIDIGWGTSISIRETVHLLAGLVGSSVQPEFGALAQRQQDTSRISDPAAAKELLGWSASTQLLDGLTTTVRWYHDHLPSTELG